MGLFAKLRWVVAGLLGRRQLEDRMSDEFRFHVEEYVADQVRNGVAEDEARRRARVEFGGVQSLKEECRSALGWRWIDEMRQDLSFAVRSLGRQKGFSLTAIVTLALGIGATTAIFSVIYAVLIRPLPYPEPDRLVRVELTSEGLFGGGPRTGPLLLNDFPEVRVQADSLADLSVYQPVAYTLTGEGDPARLAGARVSPSLFRLLGARPVVGRFFEDDEERPGNDRVAVLSYDVWTRRFGADPDIVGRAVHLDGNPYTVVGVVEEGFEFPSPEVGFWTPLAISSIPRTDGNVVLVIAGPALARLADGVPIEQAQAQVQTIVRSLHQSAPLGVSGAAGGSAEGAGPADDAPGPGLGRGAIRQTFTPPGPDGGPLLPPSADVGRGEGGGPPLPAGPPAGTAPLRREAPAFSDPFAQADVELVPIQEEMVRPVRPALLVLVGAVVFVLMIACVNVANLLLARSGTRRVEVGVRVAMGAGRLRLVRQVLTESVVLAACGGVLGLLIATLGIRLVASAEPVWLPRLEDISVNWAVLAFAGVTTLLTGLLFGLVPALRLSRTGSAWAINEGRAEAASGMDLLGRHRLRGALVAAQVALALVLLVGGGLLIHSFTNLAATPLGYDPENVTTLRVELPAGYAAPGPFYSELLRRLNDHPQVVSAALADSLPASPALLIRAANVNGELITASDHTVTPGYFETLGIPLLEGRLPTDQEREGSIIVDERLARRLFPEGAVGRVIPGPGAETIIGVVGTVGRPDNIADTTDGEMYTPYTAYTGTGNRPGFVATVILRTSDRAGSLAADVRRIVQDLDPSLAVDQVQTLESILASSIAQPRFYATALGVFAVIALTLAAVGIYGVMAYAVTQRTREIGIRMALGARREAVMRMVLAQGLTMTLAGLVAGLAGAVAVSGYLEGMLYGLTPLDARTFAMMTGVLVGAAMLACGIPLRRAMRIDPASALRHE